MGSGQPWFVAIDVCRALGMDLSKGAHRYLGGLDADEVARGNVAGMRGLSPMLISESGLYALIIKSRKPEAQRFRKWVTSEVLPTIRKTGSYTVPTRPAQPVTVQAPHPDTMQALAAAVTALNETVRMLLAAQLLAPAVACFKVVVRPLPY